MNEELTQLYKELQHASNSGDFDRFRSLEYYIGRKIDQINGEYFAGVSNKLPIRVR